MNKKVVVLGILAVCLSISIGIGFSYAVWSQTEKQSNPNLVQTGCFEISLTDEHNIINLSNQYPIPDENGKKLTPYTFTITNTCSIYASYAVNLEKLEGSDLDNQYIKVMLNNKLSHLYNYYSVATKEYDNSVESRTLTTDGLEANESKTYTLRIWLDESGTNDTVGGRTFNSKIVVSAVATYQSGAEYIASLLEGNPNTMKNDDPDENVRYIGATPNNHVTFNGEDWRIIGVFDNMWECPDIGIDVGNYTELCTQKKLLKLIRNDFFSLSWDISNVNDWSKASLMNLLNSGDYWNRSGNYLTTGLIDNAKGMIANTMWNLGGLIGGEGVLTERFYTSERGTEVYSERPTKWVGKVGLMYPSDYGYVTGGGNLKSRDACLKKPGSWNTSDFSDCKTYNWLYDSDYIQWTMTPVVDPYGVFDVNTGGSVGGNHVLIERGIRPVVYLKSEVKIIHDKDHDGSVEYPYELSL